MKLLASAFFIVTCFTSSLNAQEVCQGLLTYAARDELDFDKDTAIAQSIYSEHCEGSSSKRTSQTDVGIEAVVKAVPIKFNLGHGGSREKLNQFCKIASSQNILNEKVNLKRSTVVREALEAFNRCVEFSNKHVLFYPVIGDRELNVSIRRGSENVQIRGIEHDKYLTCHIGDREKAVTVDSNTRLPITDGTFVPLFCRRNSDKLSDGTEIFPSTTVTILTDRGNFRIPVSADAKLPIMLASAIARQIADVDAKTSEALSKLSKLSAEIECKDVISTSALSTNHYIDWKTTALNDSEVAEGWRLVGGQCSFNKIPPPVSQIYISDSKIVDGGKAYYCSSSHTPNVGTNRQLVVSARVCRAKILNR